MSWETDREWVLGALERLERKLDKLTEGHWRLYGKVAGVAAAMGVLTSLVMKLLP
jgi:hypothetical protein